MSFINKVVSSYSYKFAPKKIKAKSPVPNSKTLSQLFHSKGNWTTLGIKSRLKYTARKLKTTSIILLVLIKNHFKANKRLHTPFSNFDSVEKPKFSNTHTSINQKSFSKQTNVYIIVFFLYKLLIDFIII